MLFIEETSPPPFYQPQITDAERRQLDKWFIGERSQKYYLKRFAEFDEQGYLSAKWNWAAFFVTFGWLLYRKRFLDAIVYCVAGWSFIQVNIVMILTACEFALMPFVPYAYQMVTRIIIGLIIWLFWAVMVARWADAYYYRMARREIADAIADYPKNLEEQRAYLKREGGVSIVGLTIAFAMFIFALVVIQVQFLPLYAAPKERVIIQESYEVVQLVTIQVDNQYQVSGKCPVDLTFNTNEINLDINIVTRSEAVVNKNSPCIIEANIHSVRFPNRNLNGQKFIVYRASAEKKSKWLCLTSLNEKQTPLNCISQ